MIMSMTWNRTTDIARSLNILGNCQNKLQCLIFEMLSTKELKRLLNNVTQSVRSYHFRLFFKL